MQHRRRLSGSEVGQHDQPPVGEFERVVVGVGLFEIDLAESRDARRDLHPPRQEAVRIGEDHLAVERQFRAWPQADRDIGRADLGEAAGPGMAEFGRHQSIADLGGRRSDMLQAVVTHGPVSFAA